MWYFSRLVRLIYPTNYQHFQRLFELVYEMSTEEAESSRGILWLLHERACCDENQKLLAELQKADKLQRS